MKCVIPEIHWHNREPVLSVDIQPKIDKFLRLATSGSDSHVVIWYLDTNVDGQVKVEPAADLSRHQKSVNVVRWSASGEYLASGDDEAIIMLWKRKTDGYLPSFDRNDEEFKETWLMHKILRGHNNEVYDLCWSPDGTQLFSGSVDNTAIVWNLQKSSKHILDTIHKGYVQGVAWDPLNKFLSTLSSDRHCRVIDANTKRVISRSAKGKLPVPESSPLHGQTVRLYHDDTLKSYFRRLCFSPDGQLLIAPSGCVETETTNKKIHYTFVYIRHAFKQPAMALPSPDQFTVVVKCCPILFNLREDGPTPIVPLPYRIVISVATYSSVIFYDTQQMQPFAAVSNINYTRITDLTWSADGSVLAVSSTDGFCSIITFKENEIGSKYIPKESTSEDQSPTQSTSGGRDQLATNKMNVSISSVLVEEEIAQSGWEEDSKVLTDSGDCSVGEMEVDDKTEDFKLVLEETSTFSESSPSCTEIVDCKYKICSEKNDLEQDIQGKKDTKDLVPNTKVIEYLAQDVQNKDQPQEINITKSSKDPIQDKSQNKDISFSEIDLQDTQEKYVGATTKDLHESNTNTSIQQPSSTQDESSDTNRSKISSQLASPKTPCKNDDVITGVDESQVNIIGDNLDKMEVVSKEKSPSGSPKIDHGPTGSNSNPTSVEKVKPVTPRRVALITLSSPKIRRKLL